MKKLNIVIITLITSFVFMACEKEENSLKQDKTNLDNKKTNNLSDVNNPYDYAGQLHNEILYNFALEHNLGEVEIDDAHYYVKNYEDSLFSFDDMTLSETETNYSFTREELTNWSNGNTDNLSFPDQYSSDAYAYVEQLLNMFDDAVYAEQELTPAEFASNVNEYIVSDLLSDEDVLIRPLSYLSENGTEINEYERIMLSCAVATHSYEFWYNAFYQQDHPWHDQLHSKLDYFWDSKEPTFWGDLWNGIKTAAIYTGKAILSPFVDAGNVVGYCWEEETLSWPIGYGTNASINFVGG